MGCVGAQWAGLVAGEGGRQGYCGRDLVSSCAGLAWPVFAKGGS